MAIVLALYLAITAATGITRTPDATLEALAAQRVIEIQTTFGHRAMPELSQWSWGEVIGWNNGYTDPVAAVVNGWMASPDHRAILLGAYTHIGCAHDATADGRQWFVCILGIPPAAPPPPGQPGSGGGSVPDPLPDTATAQDIRTEQLLMLLAAGGMLVVVGMWAGLQMALWESFLDANPEIRRKYEHFLRLPKPSDPHVCPKHGMKISPGERCWVERCGWRSPPK